MSTYRRGNYLTDGPQSNSPEYEGVFHRPIYAPTPLNPYDLRKDDAPYIMHAQAVVNEVFSENLARLAQRPPEAVMDLLRTSVMSALFQRFDENSGKTLPADCDEESARLFAMACLGQAGPDELIELLDRRPNDLESIELAKQTHPFRWNTTAEMDVAIDVMMDRHHFVKNDGARMQNVRYYFTRSDDIKFPLAVIMVRKADVGVREASQGGGIIVVQRDSFVIDLFHEDTSGTALEFNAWLASGDARQQMRGNRKVQYGEPVMTRFIDDQLETKADQRSGALYPGVRSYYAHYASESADETDSMTDA
jgi:hypothetical protein